MQNTVVTEPDLEMSPIEAPRVWSQALQDGEAVGQQVFGLSVEVIVEQDTPEPAIAKYDPYADNVKIFVNKVTREAEAGADPKRLVTHAVAHEFGHAREARLFAEGGVFPWRFRTDAKSRLRTKEGFYLVKDIFPQFAQLMREIQDFPISRRFSEYGIKDPTAKVRISRIEQVRQQQSTHPLTGPQLWLQELFHLPSAIQDHMFGDISNGAKTEIRRFMTSILGATVWEEAARLMANRQFGDIPGYERVIAAYFANFLGIRATFESVTRQELGDLPPFWISPTYRIQHISSQRVSSSQQQERHSAPSLRGDCPKTGLRAYSKQRP